MPNLQPLDRGLTWWGKGVLENGWREKTRSYEETVCIVIMNHQWEISRIQQMEVLYHMFGHIVVHNMEIHQDSMEIIGFRIHNIVIMNHWKTIWK